MVLGGELNGVAVDAAFRSYLPRDLLAAMETLDLDCLHFACLDTEHRLASTGDCDRHPLVPRVDAKFYDVVSSGAAERDGGERPVPSPIESSSTRDRPIGILRNGLVLKDPDEVIDAWCRGHHHLDRLARRRRRWCEIEPDDR